MKLRHLSLVYEQQNPESSMWILGYQVPVTLFWGLLVSTASPKGKYPKKLRGSRLFFAKQTNVLLEAVKTFLGGGEIFL